MVKIHDTVGKAGMVLGEMDHGVFAGNVFGSNNDVLRPIDLRGERDAANASPGDGGAHCGSVPHAWKRLIVDIAGLSQHLGAAFLTDGRSAENRCLLRHR